MAGPHDNDQVLASRRLQLAIKAAVENVTAALVAGIPVTGITFDPDIDIGDVHLLSITDARIEPSEAQAANTAYVAADKLTPIGGIKSATRHTATELETFADDDYVPVGVTAVHELRVRDDDANTLLGGMVPTGATALNTAATTGVGTVDVITLTASTIYVDIRFDTAAHYATPGVSPPTTLYGAPYQPGITYRIQTFKTTNLYVESVGAAGAYHVTCYTRA